MVQLGEAYSKTIYQFKKIILVFMDQDLYLKLNFTAVIGKVPTLPPIREVWGTGSGPMSICALGSRVVAPGASCFNYFVYILK